MPWRRLMNAGLFRVCRVSLAVINAITALLLATLSFRSCSSETFLAYFPPLSSHAPSFHSPLFFFLLAEKNRETQRETSLTSVIMPDAERTRRQKIRAPPRERPSCRGGDIGGVLTSRSPSMKRVDFFLFKHGKFDSIVESVKDNISLKLRTFFFDVSLLQIFLMYIVWSKFLRIRTYSIWGYLTTCETILLADNRPHVDLFYLRVSEHVRTYSSCGRPATYGPILLRDVDLLLWFRLDLFNS